MMSHYRRCAAGLLLVASIVSSHANAGVLFQDGFESGARSTSSNGIRWSYSTDNVRPTTTRPLTGKYALEFPFKGVPSGEDSFEEQRILLGKAYQELWIKYDVYIPSNYYHRPNEGDNNKFFAIFNNNYADGGFQVNFSLYPASGGGSNLAVHYYRNGREAPFIYNNAAMFRAADLGKWHRIVMHFKVASSASASDGVQELWKNGTSIVSIKNLANGGPSGKNYMDEAYIWGWANTGFNEDTIIQVDDVVISDTPIPLTADGEPVLPNPPTNVRAN